MPLVRYRTELCPLYQPRNPNQNHSTDEGDNDGPDHNAAECFLLEGPLRLAGIYTLFRPIRNV